MNKIKSKLRIRRDGGSTETETGIKYSRWNACAWPIYGTAATIKIYLVDVDNNWLNFLASIDIADIDGLFHRVNLNVTRDYISIKRLLLCHYATQVCLWALTRLHAVAEENTDQYQKGLQHSSVVQAWFTSKHESHG